MFPAKPASFTRTVDLDGMQVSMTMTAAEVDGATFAVGTAEAPDEAQARAALPAMMRRCCATSAQRCDTQGKATPTPAARRRRGRRHRQHAQRRAGAPGRPGRGARQALLPGDRARQANAMPSEQVEQFLTSFTLA
jgi:hypothetical protein